MQVKTISTVGEIKPEHVKGRTVIVIDVLRASSTIVAAFDSGIKSIIPVKKAEEALALRSLNTILAGEWHCKKIKGFDYNNSPTILKTKKHTGKHLVLLTTNGTQAMEKAAQADRLLIGCFLNASACIKEALVQNSDITIYCAGTRNEFSFEDGLAAGMMIHLVKKQASSIVTCDFSDAMEASFLQLAKKLPQLLYTTTTGKRLLQNQFEEDIRYCGQIDISQIVPILKGNRILSLSDT
jgi:2-phosphosulfolactate phosphatase